MVVDSVNRRLEAVVGHALQKVANVDHKGALDGRDLDPLTLVGQDLQPADVVLPQEGEALQIRVGTQSYVDGVCRAFVLGVVVEDAVTVWCWLRVCVLMLPLKKI